MSDELYPEDTLKFILAEERERMDLPDVVRMRTYMITWCNQMTDNIYDAINYNKITAKELVRRYYKDDEGTLSDPFYVVESFLKAPDALVSDSPIDIFITKTLYETVKIINLVKINLRKMNVDLVENEKLVQNCYVTMIKNGEGNIYNAPIITSSYPGQIIDKEYVTHSVQHSKIVLKTVVNIALEHVDRNKFVNLSKVSTDWEEYIDFLFLNRFPYIMDDPNLLEIFLGEVKSLYMSFSPEQEKEYSEILKSIHRYTAACIRVFSSVSRTYIADTFNNGLIAVIPITKLQFAVRKANHEKNP
jgi:hypothetical protein